MGNHTFCAGNRVCVKEDGVKSVTRTEKQEFVASLRTSMESAGVVVVVQQSGLTVSEVTDLRHKMRKAGAAYKVSKNTLASLAFKGTPYEGLVDFLKGPTAIAYSTDPIAAAKTAVDFSKTNEKLRVVAGQMDGKTLSEKEVKALASLPSLDELRAKILCMLQTPATRLACLTQAPASQVARVIGAYASKS